MTRILVTGSRDWTDVQAIVAAFELLETRFPNRDVWQVVHGDCPSGADRIADDYARYFLTLDAERHPANWARYGRKAGMMRNTEMVDLGAVVCLAFLMPCARPKCRIGDLHGSHGTTDCATKAKAASIETLVTRRGFDRHDTKPTVGAG